ncbi:DUF2865 domain-containing protein [Chelatococcus reniformis]|uniref:DUF2865 domain-containing protein n=1 Tax=Chelatococcus reniformis TaxID=1494448 RepID=UPI00166B7306|nr:DUF2865 domain-containing protein [Chelatococcus reniformis]
MACLLGLAALAMPARAADNAGIYEFLSGNNGRAAARPQVPRAAAPARYAPYAAYAVGTPTYAPAQNTIRVQGRRSIRKTPRGSAAAGGGSAPSGKVFANPANMADGGQFAPVSRGKVCVRLCDGFQYPAENLGSSDDVTEMLCQARCPDSEVRMFTVRDADSLNSATDRDKRAYRDLATAFSYQRERPAACSCRNPSKLGKTLSPLEDPTLRRGDTVITEEGAKVFRGSPGRAHHEREFADATKVGYLSPSQKAAFGIAPLKSFVSKTRRRDARILASEEYGPAMPGAVVAQPSTAQDVGSRGDPRVILASPFADADAFSSPKEAPPPVVEPTAADGEQLGAVGATAVGTGTVSASTATVAR